MATARWLTKAVTHWDMVGERQVQLAGLKAGQGTDGQYPAIVRGSSMALYWILIADSDIGSRRGLGGHSRGALRSMYTMAPRPGHCGEFFADWGSAPWGFRGEDIRLGGINSGFMAI